MQSLVMCCSTSALLTGCLVRNQITIVLPGSIPSLRVGYWKCKASKSGNGVAAAASSFVKKSLVTTFRRHSCRCSFTVTHSFEEEMPKANQQVWVCAQYREVLELYEFPQVSLLHHVTCSNSSYSAYRILLVNLIIKTM